MSSRARASGRVFGRASAVAALLAASCATGSSPGSGDPRDAAAIDAPDDIQGGGPDAKVDAKVDARNDREPIDADVDDPDATVDARVNAPVDASVDARGIDAGPVGGLGPWTGRDNVPPSQSPPFGLSPSEVPQFVVLGFDDNAYSGLPNTGGTGGMEFVLGLPSGRTNFDGSPIRFSFYLTSWYVSMWVSESPVYVKRQWHRIRAEGHEFGNHTQFHNTSETTPAATWQQDIDTCDTWMSKPFNASEDPNSPSDASGAGLPLAESYGFRTPFLAYNADTLTVVNAKSHFWYDSSIEEGYQWDQNGTNFLWPYTLDNGSPGHQVQVEWPGSTKKPLRNEPGLWELPAYAVIVPPDDKCAEYGVPSGLRGRLKQRITWFDESAGKFTGFDYNLWSSRNVGGLEMTKAEFLATLKYTLDQRLRGNRAPFYFGVHSDTYSTKWQSGPGAGAAERQAALVEFIDYARSKREVRITTAKATLDWIRNPTRLP